MKKYFFLLSAALLALSCGKEQPGDGGDAPAVDPNTKAVTFECVAAAFTDGSTTYKAWKAGDEISVYFIDADGNPATAVAKTDGSGETAVFTARIPLTAEPVEYYATYPAEKGILTVNVAPDETPGESTEDSSSDVNPGVNAASEEASEVSFEIIVDGSSFDGSFDRAKYAAAYCVADEQMTLEFAAATGVFKLALPEGGKFVNGDKELPVTGVYLRNVVDPHKLNGKISVTVADGKVTGFGDPLEEASANINMQELSDAALASGYVYIPCTPTTWESGVCVRFYSSEGGIPAFNTAEGQQVSVTRGEVNSLSVSTDNIVWTYYVSAEGSDEGAGTEDDPMSMTALQTLFTANAATMAGSLKFDGTTIVIGEGTYSLTAPLSFPSLAVYDITVEGSGAVLDGGETTNLFKAGNQNITFRGITFQNGKAADKGGVAHVTKGNLRFENCTFQNNNAKTGGVMMVQGVEIEFDGCSFKENSATNGSVFGINTATVKCNRCYFKDNKGIAIGNTSGDNGAVFYGTESPAAYLNSCYFVGNTKDGKSGVCVYFNNAQGKIAMNNVTISGGSTDKTQAMQVCCKGYSVISNSTLWATKVTWGVFGMGYNGTTKGAVLVNNILCNKEKTQPGVGTTQDYQLRSAYNIISAVSPLSPTATLGSYDTENCVTGMFNGGNPFAFKSQQNVPGNGQLYTWDGTLGKCTDVLTGTLTNPTLAQVEAEILKAEGIGSDFLTWLKSIKTEDGKNALEVDIRGVARDTQAMWPGAYQESATSPAE